MVPTPGYAPGHSVLQTDASTRLAWTAKTWCSRVELNHLFNLTKIVLYHLTTRAWGEAGNRTLSICFTDRYATITSATPLLARGTGIEPVTRGIKIRCSTS